MNKIAKAGMLVGLAAVVKLGHAWVATGDDYERLGQLIVETKDLQMESCGVAYDLEQALELEQAARGLAVCVGHGFAEYEIRLEQREKDRIKEVMYRFIDFTPD